MENRKHNQGLLADSVPSPQRSGVKGIMKSLKETLPDFYQELISALKNLNRTEVWQSQSLSLPGQHW